jgi:hypothetical protein
MAAGGVAREIYRAEAYRRLAESWRWHAAAKGVSKHMTSASLWQENIACGRWRKRQLPHLLRRKSWQRAEAYRLAGIALIWAAELGSAHPQRRRNVGGRE